MNRNIIVATFAVATSAGCQQTSEAPRKQELPAAAASAVKAAGESPAEARTKEQLIALGNHLVSTSGCHDCHTPWKVGPKGPAPDMTRALSGHPADMKLPPPPAPIGPWIVSIAATNTAYAGPWGTSFTANLTPDMATGLGAWSKETFIQTIRTGRHMGRGRPLLPPMPEPVYQNFSDEELGAIFTYLQTIPAIENAVPEPLPPPAAKAHG
jgi:mono/diheme cytochrome c family protein